MRIKALLTALLLSISVPAVRASDFFMGLTSYGSSFWISSPTTVIVYAINSIVGMGGTNAMGYDWISIAHNNGSSVSVDNGNYFGFKSKDLFNNFGAGLQVGYQPMYSIFGIWVNGGYKFRQFGMDLEMAEQQSKRYILNAWYIGLGIRLAPFKSMLENQKWSPFIDFGTSYNSIFSAKAPFDNDISQFGKGMSTYVGFGARFILNNGYYDDIGMNVSISFTFPQYNYFNRDFTLSNGIKPYADIKARNYSVFLNLMYEL